MSRRCFAKKPSIILSLPVDPATAGPIYDPALKAGVKLAFVDNSPLGYVQGKDYVTIVSDDLFQMGHKAGVAMAEALGKKGKVGYIFHDADFYVTNQRDQAFKSTIEQDYPDMKITAEAGMADPARAEEIAQAMVTQNPDLDGIYVTWAEPALSVLSTLRSAGETPIPRSSRSISTNRQHSTWSRAAPLQRSLPTKPTISA